LGLGVGKEQQGGGLHDHDDRIGEACGTNGKKRGSSYSVAEETCARDATHNLTHTWKDDIKMELKWH